LLVADAHPSPSAFSKAAAVGLLLAGTRQGSVRVFRWPFEAPQTVYGEGLPPLEEKQPIFAAVPFQ